MKYFKILAQVRFTTSKVEHYGKNKNLCFGAAERVAEPLKTQDLRKLGNIRRISKMGP